jgi:hypothetical protein
MFEQAISPKTGYVGGGMQQLVDIGIGPVGDVWVTNNWENDAAAFGHGLGGVAEKLARERARKLFESWPSGGRIAG